MKNETKKVYTTPALTVHGDAAQLTQAAAAGSRFDRAFGTIINPGDSILMS